EVGGGAAAATGVLPKPPDSVRKAFCQCSRMTKPLRVSPYRIRYASNSRRPLTATRCSTFVGVSSRESMKLSLGRKLFGLESLAARRNVSPGFLNRRETNFSG